MISCHCKHRGHAYACISRNIPDRAPFAVIIVCVIIFFLSGKGGGAQPGVERVDIGPEMQIRSPLPNIPARIAVEWRERIAGRAAPSSGLAITLAADF